jgi:hypothetical protein
LAALDVVGGEAAQPHWFFNSAQPNSGSRHRGARAWPVAAVDPSSSFRLHILNGSSCPSVIAIGIEHEAA